MGIVWLELFEKANVCSKKLLICLNLYINAFEGKGEKSSAFYKKKYKVTYKKTHYM